MEMVVFLLIIVGVLAFIGNALGEGEKYREVTKSNHEKIMSGEGLPFVPTSYIKNTFSDITLYIDKNTQKLAFVNLERYGISIYRFDEIIDCAILEDGATIVTAIALMSPTKPISLSLSVRIITSNIDHPLYEIPLITSSTKRDSVPYKQKVKFAQEVYATIISIINSKKSE
ncbi:MAG: hypothetical protein HFG13_01565 [Oscillibacter sp.]|nr:hypothetical protein [Oscillibacter sp.]